MMDAKIAASHCNGIEPHFHCPTCSDEGLPAKVVAIDSDENTATVRIGDGERQVALDLLDDVRVGQYLLVHLDVAIAKLDAAEVVEA